MISLSLSRPLRIAASFVAASAIALANTSCTDMQPNAATGAVAGAIIGGIIGGTAGNNSDDLYKGAIIGAAAGAAAGGLMKAKRYKGAGGSPYGDQSYPIGKRTADPNFVESPYPPHNVIDVTGFRSGELAVDPTTNQVFRVP